MVERLKAVIERARQQRAAVTGAMAPAAMAATPPTARRADLLALSEIKIDRAAARRARIIDAAETPEEFAAKRAFDLLRTRLAQTRREAGVRRIGVSSPKMGCGKSTLVLNLALSTARKSRTCCALLDFDMRRPALSRLLGVSGDRDMARFLSGESPADEVCARIGENLILGLNDKVCNVSSELMQDPAAAAALEALEERFAPDIMLFDLPPITVSDDVIALLPRLDGLILVLEADQATAKQVAECERMIGSSDKFLGVVLNKSRADAGGVAYSEY